MCSNILADLELETDFCFLFHFRSTEYYVVGLKRQFYRKTSPFSSALLFLWHIVVSSSSFFFFFISLHYCVRVWNAHQTELLVKHLCKRLSQFVNKRLTSAYQFDGGKIFDDKARWESLRSMTLTVWCFFFLILLSPSLSQSHTLHAHSVVSVVWIALKPVGPNACKLVCWREISHIRINNLHLKTPYIDVNRIAMLGEFCVGWEHGYMSTERNKYSSPFKILSYFYWEVFFFFFCRSIVHSVRWSQIHWLILNNVTILSIIVFPDFLIPHFLT